MASQGKKKHIVKRATSTKKVIGCEVGQKRTEKSVSIGPHLKDVLKDVTTGSS